MFRLSYAFGKDPEQVRILINDRDTLDRKIRHCGNPIFFNSMSDTFHNKIPDSIRNMWFSTFEDHPEKQFQILTKRTAKMARYFENRRVPDNVWLGTSVGIKQAIPRIDILRKIECKIHFISFEPLLEDLGKLDLKGIEWGIVGGESDKSSPRPMKPEWAISLMKQMKKQKVSAFFKQRGGKGGDLAGGEICYCCNDVHQEMPQFPESASLLTAWA